MRTLDLTIVSAALSSVLLPRCILCGNKVISSPFGEKYQVCSNCLSDLVPSDREKRWLMCLSEPYKGDPIPKLVLYSPFPYSEQISHGIRKLKFHNRIEIGSFFGKLMGTIMKADNVKCDAVIPVPLAEERFRERGYNQALIIAENCAEVLGVPVLDGVLLRTRYTKRQTELKSNDERFGNVVGAFEMNGDWDISGLNVILLDDIATTGSTLHEAADVLYRAGVKSVLCAAFASNRIVKNSESY